jgi:hypothetical protein
MQTPGKKKKKKKKGITEMCPIIPALVKIEPRTCLLSGTNTGTSALVGSVT